MKKVLIIITTAYESNGGLATVMMNYYRNINKENYKIDFASTNESETVLIDELKEYGGRYYNLGDRKKSLVKYMLNLMSLIRKEKYDVIHVNGNSATMVFELFVAWLFGVKKRIAHGHTTRSNYPKMHNILSPFFKKTYTDAIAVSKDTGEWLYEKNYTILNNAIDVKHYGFNVETRKRIREKWNVEDKFVVGNVGKLNAPKNHTFLIDIFKEISKERDDAVLVIAGGGELLEELKKKCKDLSIDEKVIFLGMLDDVSEALQAFDVFVFTSKFEGLGMALIEAQASGLECIVSDVVPIETKVTDHIHYISLNQSAEFWAGETMKYSDYDRKEHSESAAKTIRDCGYDIRFEGINLEKIYNR